MSWAILNLHVMPFRLMKKADAAHYCAMSAKTFESQCPVRPIDTGDGKKVWDVVDLDAWINALKVGHKITDDDILARLRCPRTEGDAA